jgi:hypothetical protein
MGNAEAHEAKLCISYTSSRFTSPAHTVGFRSDVTGWGADTTMTPVEEPGRTVWRICIGSGHGVTTEYRFKLVLDGAHWQAGWDQTASTTDPPTAIAFDDGTLTWEGVPDEPVAAGVATGHGTPDVTQPEHGSAPPLLGTAAAVIEPARARAAAVARATWRTGSAVAAAFACRAARVARAAVARSQHRGP